ncbi:hypothetical protein Acr_06g0002580 [Actinidia rufa]|uniref:Uncharacterized protein n=1 Tax=Actinidia rufa TaxID=165716 RepID=A0A7J0EPA1_9ERIC|nr:hypothetical protein Acr_06g0002580 [Actinidia rufa]
MGRSLNGSTPLPPPPDLHTHSLAVTCPPSTVACPFPTLSPVNAGPGDGYEGYSFSSEVVGVDPWGGCVEVWCGLERGGNGLGGRDWLRMGRQWWIWMEGAATGVGGDGGGEQGNGWKGLERPGREREGGQIDVKSARVVKYRGPSEEPCW